MVFKIPWYLKKDQLQLVVTLNKCITIKCTYVHRYLHLREDTAGNEGGLRGQVLTILPLWPLGAFEMQVIRVQSRCLSLTSRILVAQHAHYILLVARYCRRRRKDGPRPPLGRPHINEEEKRNKSLHCSHFWQHTPLAVFRQKDSSELPPVGLFNHDLPFLGLFGNVQWLSGSGFICTITCMHIHTIQVLKKKNDF